MLTSLVWLIEPSFILLITLGVSLLWQLHMFAVKREQFTRTRKHFHLTTLSHRTLHTVNRLLLSPYCVICLVLNGNLNLQSHLCDLASCTISTLDAPLPKLGQTHCSETRMPISATRNYRRNTGVFSDLDSESTLHYTLRSDSPSSSSLLFFLPCPALSLRPSSLICGLQSRKPNWA